MTLENAAADYANKLAEVLYELDPAHTCCKENECEDEYVSFAYHVAIDYICRGNDEAVALSTTYTDFFDDTLSTEDTKSIVEKVQELYLD